MTVISSLEPKLRRLAGTSWQFLPAPLSIDLPTTVCVLSGQDLQSVGVTL
jgi:hypothetical protein